jgi:hypothetical protein
VAATAPIASGPVRHWRSPDVVLWRRWTGWCLLGEAGGIAMTAVFAYPAVRLDAVGSPAVAALVLLLATAGGVGEGASLGLAQWHVLRRVFPALRRRAWVGATAAIAATGWLLGMLPHTVADALSAPGESTAAGSGPAAGPGPLVATALLLVIGAGGGALVGAVQAVPLRRHVAAVWPWLVGNAVGWTLGFAMIWAALSGVSAGASATEMVLAGLAGGAAAGLAVGAVTGAALVRLRPVHRAAAAADADADRRVAGRAGPPALVNGMVRLALRGPTARLLPALGEITVVGRRSGRRISTPVQVAPFGTDQVILCASASAKRWWRNVAEPGPAWLRVRGRVLAGSATVLPPGAGEDAARTAWRQRFPRAKPGSDTVTVLFHPTVPDQK